MKSTGNRGFVHHLVAYSIAAIGFGGSFGVGSVWLQHQISVSANESKALEARLAAVGRQEEELRAAIAQEEDVGVLLRRNADWGLALAPPAPGQVMRIAEDPVRNLEAKRDRDLFRNRIEAVSFRVALQH
jgi:hypothetical protein